MDIKVSVIVPIYNSEKYLGKCLDSLKNQSLRDIEVICVDDESTDGSSKIVKDIVAVDCRFRYIKKKHEGYGAAAARNEGLKYASGKYVIFLDSDDWFDELMTEQIDALKKQLDDIKAYQNNKKKHDDAVAEQNRREKEVKPALEQALDEAQKHQTEIDTLAKEIPQMELLMPRYKELTDCEKKLKENEITSQKNHDAIAKLEKEQENLSKTIQDKEKELEGIKDPGADIATHENQMNKLVEDGRKLKDLKTGLEAYNIEYSKLPSLQNAAKSAEEARQNANADYEQKYHLFIAEQAGYLAEALEEDQACPVCGSTHHPHLAEKAPSAPTKAELETLKKQVEKLSSNAQQANGNFTPRPRKESVASVMIVEPRLIVHVTISCGMTFGIRCLKILRDARIPQASVAVMNSCSRRDRI